MIPRLAKVQAPAPLHVEFLAELRVRGFEGQLSLGHADRTVLSTDNSIYQLFPQAIAFPAGTDDLVRIATVAAEPRFRALKLAPRGGGTGTNGQSLTDGLVVDLSRNMNRILEIDPARRRVRVQAGVVKDQLNKALEPYGLFFAPELSTSNRATIGGMINTDACGQGSCIYGKTSNHVLSLTTVLLDGTVWTSHPLDERELQAVEARPDRVGAIHRLVNTIHRENEALIAERFPKLNRSLTGYDLAHIRDREGRFNLNAILCGAEGTLGLIAEAELNVLPIPKHSALINIRYDSFDAALRDARALVAVQAASIETVDSRVLGLARGDIIWHEVQEFFPDDPEGPAAGINLVEFLADDAEDLEAQLARVTAMLTSEGRANGRRGFTVARNEEQVVEAGLRIAEDGDEAEQDGNGTTPPPPVKAVERIWGMRKKSVGLLGNMAGSRRPIPFVEDTAVPPEHLADYIAEFRAALDRRGLVYGMFGHVDAGVLHVRPAIDMTDPAQEPLIREISDEVVALTRKYGGVLWGEHGKGVRSEYTPAFFGPLYPCLQQDQGRLRPLRPAQPRQDRDARRGQPAADRRGPDPRRPRARDPAGHPGELRQRAPLQRQRRLLRLRPRRRHVPVLEGHARAPALAQGPGLGLARVAAPDGGRRRRPGGGGGEASRHTGMAHACQPGSPTRSASTAAFLTSRTRSRRRWMAASPARRAPASARSRSTCPPSGRSSWSSITAAICARRRTAWSPRSSISCPMAARLPALYNLVAGTPPGQLLNRWLGLVALPQLPGLRLDRELASRGIRTATPQALAALSAAERARSVVLVQDAFTSHFEPALVLDLLDLLTGLGFKPWLAPFRPNGKPLHVHGFLGRFERVAARNATMLRSLAAEGVPLVGLDPSMTLTYRSEYKALGADAVPKVQLVQEWLAQHLDELPRPPRSPEPHSYILLPHCTERANAPAHPATGSACSAGSASS